MGELRPKPKTRLLPLLRLEKTMTTMGGTENMLDMVEKVLEGKWRFASLSTLVCMRVNAEVCPEDTDERGYSAV